MPQAPSLYFTSIRPRLAYSPAYTTPPLHALCFHLPGRLLQFRKMTMQPSSPRLPSPPPPTEIQIGPKSPSLGSSAGQEPLLEQSVIEANAGRRIHPGTKSADMAAGPPLVPLSEVHLQQNHCHGGRLTHFIARFRLPTPRTPQSPSLSL